VTVRVAMVGCGFIGGIHSRALRGLVRGGLVDAEVVAFADEDVERARAFADAHGAVVATDDPGAALDGADAVWVCTPTSEHRRLVEQAADAGLAIFCEKPLATNLDDVEAMAGMVEASGVAHQVGLVLRAAAPVACVRDMVQQTGRPMATTPPGRPMAAVLRDDQYFPDQGQYGSTWRADVAVAGGGTLLEHSIHDVDVLAWVLGPVEEVSAHTANFAGHVGVEDVAVVTLRHASGATSSLVSVWHQILSRPSTRRLEVFCEQAMVWLDDEQSGPVRVADAQGERQVTAITARDWIGELAVPMSWRPGLAAYAAAGRGLACRRRPARCLAVGARWCCAPCWPPGWPLLSSGALPRSRCSRAAPATRPPAPARSESSSSATAGGVLGGGLSGSLTARRLRRSGRCGR